MRLQSIPALFASVFLTSTLLHAQKPLEPSEFPQPVASDSATAPAEPAHIESATAPTTQFAQDANSQIKAALDVLTSVLEQYRKSGNRIGEAGTLCAIANSYNALNQQQKAIEQFQLALTIFRETSGHKQDEARTLSHIGDVYRGWGFPEQSVHFYRDALAIYAHIDDNQGKAVALNNIGVTYLSLRDKKKCLEYLNQALSFYRAAGDRRAVALTQNNLGMAYGSLAKDPQKALDYFQEAMTGLQLSDDRDSEATVLDNIGAVCVKLGQKNLAESSFDHALAIFRRAGDAEGAARVQKHLRMLGVSGAVASSRPGATAE